jgi:ribosomal protein L32E
MNLYCTDPDMNEVEDVGRKKRKEIINKDDEQNIHIDVENTEESS